VVFLFGFWFEFILVFSLCPSPPTPSFFERGGGGIFSGEFFRMFHFFKRFQKSVGTSSQRFKWVGLSVVKLIVLKGL